MFGHAQFNEKDIPFLSFWIINTYISLSIVESFYLEKKININKVILLSLLTAFLIGIRTLGLLICFQYLISIIILFNIKKIYISDFVKKGSIEYFLLGELSETGEVHSELESEEIFDANKLEIKTCSLNNWEFLFKKSSTFDILVFGGKLFKMTSKDLTRSFIN